MGVASKFKFSIGPTQSFARLIVRSSRQRGDRLGSRCGRNGMGKALSGPRIGSPASSFQRRACSGVRTARMRSDRRLAGVLGGLSRLQLADLAEEGLLLDRADLLALPGREPERLDDLRLAKGGRPLRLEGDLAEPDALRRRQDRVDLRLVGAGLLQGDPRRARPGAAAGRGRRRLPSTRRRRGRRARPPSPAGPRRAAGRRGPSAGRAGRAGPRRGGPPGRRGSSRPAAWCRAARPARPGRSAAAAMNSR